VWISTLGSVDGKSRTDITDITNLPTVADREDREWLPIDRSCPSWCNREHAQALAEGNGWEDSKEHQGHSFEYMLGGTATRWIIA